MCGLGLCEGVAVEGGGEEVAQDEVRAAVVAAEGDDVHLFVEFEHDLAAGAAGGEGDGLGAGDDADEGGSGAFDDDAADGDAFGAVGEAVTGVLDVAAGDDVVVVCVDGGADAKLGVGGVGVGLGGAGCGEEAGDQVVGWLHKG